MAVGRTAVFLETSALIELSFWDKATKDKVRALFPANCHTITSRFVIYEVCRGFLSNLRLLHNKTLQVTTFAEMFVYAAHCQRAGHKLGTILGAFAEYHNQPSAFEDSTSGERLRDFRGYLRRIIRRGFTAMDGNVDSVVNDVGCREDIGAPLEDADGYIQHELKKKFCGQESNCGLRRYYRIHQDDFKRIRSAMDETLDPETKRRRDALPVLYRVKGRNFEKGICYACGDATITHESPQQAVLVTKNGKHIKPIAAVLNKVVESYT